MLDYLVQFEEEPEQQTLDKLLVLGLSEPRKLRTSQPLYVFTYLGPVECLDYILSRAGEIPGILSMTMDSEYRTKNEKDEV